MYKGKIQLRDLSKELQVIFANAASNGGGIAYLKGTSIITSDTHRVEIPVAYDARTDMMMIMHNSTYMEIRRDYTINTDENVIEKSDGEWIASSEEPGVFNFVLFKAIPASDIVVDGKILIPGSVGKDAISQEYTQWIENKITNITNSLNTNGIKMSGPIAGLQGSITNLTQALTQLAARPTIFTQSGDPGSKARTGDVWIDTGNNLVKYRLSNGTWKTSGAAYN